MIAMASHKVVGSEMAINITEVYGLLRELNGIVKGVEENVKELKTAIADSEKNSTASRANVHKRLDEVVLRTSNLEVELSSVKHKVDDMQWITDSVQVLTHKAQGAGTLGHWLVKIGIAVVGFAGWVLGVYTYLTGRPPP